MNPYSISQEKLPELCRQVRRDIVRMVHAVNSGHPGGSLGCAEFFTALYGSIMKHDPSSFRMDGIGEDIFILSNGHISPVWYSILARTGYFPVSELATFRKLDSRLQGHPATAEHLEGIRVASGSLGQGLSVALGAALAKKLNGDDRRVFTLHGDGELQEGQIWEAALAAPNMKADNLICTVDWNGRQIDGDTDTVMPLGDLKAKFEAFGWLVFVIEKGNDLAEVTAGLQRAVEASGKGRPVMNLMRTEMGAGVDFMMGSHKWHGVAPNDEQLQSALGQLQETSFGDY
ncbi:MAG: transketolase [Flavobacteriales bacterium]